MRCQPTRQPLMAPKRGLHPSAGAAPAAVVVYDPVKHRKIMWMDGELKAKHASHVDVFAAAEGNAPTEVDTCFMVGRRETCDASEAAPEAFEPHRMSVTWMYDRKDLSLIHI